MYQIMTGVTSRQTTRNTLLLNTDNFVSKPIVYVCMYVCMYVCTGAFQN